MSSKPDRSLATTPLGTWKLSKGHKPMQVTIEERADRGNRLQIRWWVPTADGATKGRYWKGMLDPRYHPTSVRTAAGELDEVPLNTLDALAATVRGELLAGRDPEPLIRPTPLVVAPAPMNQAGPLTIRSGVELAYPDTTVPGEQGGVFGRDSRTARETRASARRGLEAAERLLGPQCTRDQLRASVWRTLGHILLEWKRPFSQLDPKAPGFRRQSRPWPRSPGPSAGCRGKAISAWWCCHSTVGGASSAPRSRRRR